MTVNKNYIKNYCFLSFKHLFSFLTHHITPPYIHQSASTSWCQYPPIKQSASTWCQYPPIKQSRPCKHTTWIDILIDYNIYLVYYHPIFVHNFFIIVLYGTLRFMDNNDHNKENEAQPCKDEQHDRWCRQGWCHAAGQGRGQGSHWSHRCCR